MNELSLRLNMPPDVARVCCDSVGMEIQNETTSRSQVLMNYDSHGLELHVSSQDLISMRASLNTYFRWTIMCYDLLIIKTKNGSSKTNSG